MTWSHHAAGAGAVVLTAALLLAGCTTALPRPEAEPPVIGAVVSEDQETQIIARVAGAVGRATTERDVAALAARTAGPARQMRTSQIEVARLRGDDELVTSLPMTMQAVMLPSDAAWPRTSLAVSTPSDDKLTPLLYAFEQRSAREDYKLWGWVQLQPDVTLPRFASTDTGAGSVRADDAETLAMSPKAALAAYAAVLSDPEGKFADTFDDDVLRQFLLEQEREQTSDEKFTAAGGRYDYDAKPGAAGLRAMRTVDGGAIVLGALDSVLAVAVEECGKIRAESLAPSQRALFGDQAESNVLRTRYLDTVALHVPPAGSGSRVRLVGFDHVAVAVESAGDTSGCGA
ncbi:hypothetical protein [Myceligenerans crystallogenes]|uniref:DUF8094 domain-containing protein n=1 Tax=Myceligenerans crystallogenes TaxID=316335 RepID=A0ABP4ZX79_9MICO